MSSKSVDYKTVEYGMIAERLSDYQLGMFIDGIENYLAMNIGTSDFAFSRMNKKYRDDVNRFRKSLEKMVEEMEDDAEQDH